MYFYVYKTTNITNGKYYIGAHRSSSLDDGYLGSGKHLNRAIRKYGRSNFTREILKQCDSEKEMFLYEEELVSRFLGNPNCYNLASGGRGGSIIQNRKPFTQKHSEKTKTAIRAKNSGKRHSKETIQKLRENNWARTNPEAQRDHARKAALISHLSREPVILSEARKQKISGSLKAYFSMYGSSLSGKPKKKIECPHCKKLIARNTANRWHFSNCKSIR